MKWFEDGASCPFLLIDEVKKIEYNRTKYRVENKSLRLDKREVVIKAKQKLRIYFRIPLSKKMGRVSLLSFECGLQFVASEQKERGVFLCQKRKK